MDLDGMLGTDLLTMPRGTRWVGAGTGRIADRYDPEMTVSVTRVLLEGLSHSQNPYVSVKGIEVLLGSTEFNTLRALALVDTTWGLEFVSDGLTEDELVEVVRSVPVIGAPELLETTAVTPIQEAVPAEELSGWLESGLPVRFTEGTDLLPLPDVMRRHQDVVMVAGSFTEGGRALAILDARVNPLRSLAMIVPSAQLVGHKDVPMVTSWDPDAGRADVMWVHRDRFWHLMSRDDVAGLTRLASRICDRVAGLR